MREFPACCGAMYDPSAQTLNVSSAEDPTPYLIDTKQLGFLITNKLPDKPKAAAHFKTVYEAVNPLGVKYGLYLAHNETSAYGPWTPEKPFRETLPDEDMLPVYKIEGYNPYLYIDHPVMETSLIASFPYAAYKTTVPKYMRSLKNLENAHTVAILAGPQHDLWEDMLLKTGFQVVQRAQNPKHGTQLTFYYRSPHSLEVFPPLKV